MGISLFFPLFCCFGTKKIHLNKCRIVIYWSMSRRQIIFQTALGPSRLAFKASSRCGTPWHTHFHYIFILTSPFGEDPFLSIPLSFFCRWNPKFWVNSPVLPSGKRLHNYGKSPFFHGKTHYFYGHVQVRKLLVITRGFHGIYWGFMDGTFFHHAPLGILPEAFTWKTTRISSMDHWPPTTSGRGMAMPRLVMDITRTHVDVFLWINMGLAF